LLMVPPSLPCCRVVKKSRRNKASKARGRGQDKTNNKRRGE
jgi:hypothetical protein